MSGYSTLIFDSPQNASELTVIMRNVMIDKDLRVVLQEAGWCGSPNRYTVESPRMADSDYVEKLAHAVRKLDDVTSVMLLDEEGRVTPLDPIDTSDTPVIPNDGSCPIPPRP